MTAARRSPHESKAGRAGAGRNRLRIIGGHWRSRIVRFPDSAGLRPTPDRVRETLFNWLGQRLAGLTGVDLFAGSGALGFEARSRGAHRVVLVERERAVCEHLRRSAAELGMDGVEVVQADALAWLGTGGERFDLAFVDLPYGLGLAASALAALEGRVQSRRLGLRRGLGSGRGRLRPAGRSSAGQARRGTLCMNCWQR